MDKKTHSAFAMALRSLLDEHPTMKRAQWAEVLAVSEAAISQWVNDAAIPKAENLRAIMNTLLADRRVPAPLLEAFEELLRRPSTDVTPNGERMKPTIAHYMIKPLRDGFLRTLDTLPPESQEVALLDGAARCRQLRASPLVRRSIEERRRLRFEALVEEAIGTNGVGVAATPVRLGEEEIRDEVPSVELAAQSWMQELLLVSVTAVDTSSVTKPLRTLRKAVRKDPNHSVPIDEASIWIRATNDLFRGVKNTIDAAEELGVEFTTTHGQAP